MDDQEQQQPPIGERRSKRSRTYRFAGVFLLFAAFWAFITTAPGLLNPEAYDPEKTARDKKWVSTSPYFLDRQCCRWFMLCGLHHVRADPASRAHITGWENPPDLARRMKNAAVGNNTNPTDDVPDYVLRHAPLVHLYSGEQFWPSDMTSHLRHMNVTTDKSDLIPDNNHHWTLDNLRQLNDINATVFLQSQQDVETRPPWLHSADNIPSSSFSSSSATTKQPRHPHAKPPPPSPHGHKPNPKDGYSPAPSILILVDKGSSILDAFWFFFYSYNLGQTVLGTRYGNHVGDWEHCMIRFQHGKPHGVFLSAHAGGQAYAWDVMKKENKTRPLIYSAMGSHAMYAIAGDHPYVLPLNLLKDQTDDGPIWDPALNRLAYFYDFQADDEDGSFPDAANGTAPFQPPPVQVPEQKVMPGTLPQEEEEEEEEEDGAKKRETLVPAASNPDAPTSWFHYKGHWGDEMYTLADERQWRLFGQYHYVTGPTGPKNKRLGRSAMCLKDECEILHELDPSSTWY